MITETMERFTKLAAQEGMVLTDGDTFAEVVCTTKPEIWSEVEPPDEKEDVPENETEQTTEDIDG